MLQIKTTEWKTGFLLGLLLPMQLALAQSLEVTGLVTDASTDRPLAGVNILVDGTSIGAISDAEGNFSMKVPGENRTLVFSHVAYRTDSVIPGKQRIINLAMIPLTQEIDEVIAIGYGTIKKTDLTGAIASVKQADIEKAAPVNVLTAIQGRAAGVYVSQNSGAPGLEPVIRIRGVGTVNAHAPIYVIDGVILDPSDARDEASTINFLNPSDIERIEVLKDASASAIYGSRGANGVIMITTHKGFDSTPKVSFKAQLGFAKVQELPENLGSEEYLAYVREAYANGKNTTQPDTLNEVKNVIEQYNKAYDTDWVDEVIKDGPALSQNYNLAIKGGSETARYASGFGYYDETGILVTNSRYKRYTFRINSDFDLGKIFRIGENLSISQNYIHGPIYHGIAGVRDALATSPLYPVYKDPADPDYKDPSDPDYEYYKFAGAPNDNPVAETYYNLNAHTNTLTVFGNVFAEARFLKDFTLRSSLGIKLSNRKLDEFNPAYHISPSNNQISQVHKWSDWTQGWLWENTLGYHKKLGKHNFGALFGYTSEYNNYDYMIGRKWASPSNEEEMGILDAATSTPELEGRYDIITMISMLGRINYTFDNRYLLTASVRRDGSSKFGPGNKWGVFPSVSLGWNISNEGFFEGLKSNTFPLFKLRAGWGQIGNSSMSDNNTNTYTSQFSTSLRLRALFNNEVHNGYFFNVIGISDLSWETTEQINVGLDLALFRNALSLEADFYKKTTEDMLVRTNVPHYAGYGMSGKPWINAGTMENTGFEFLLNYKGNAGKFSYDLSLNGSTYKNKVISTNYDSTGIWQLGASTLTLPGYPVGSFVGYVTDGIFQTMDEVNRYVDPVSEELIQPKAQPGDIRFKDLDGDGSISNSDQTFIGNPHPDFIFGLTINLAYRGFDIMTHWQGVLGNDLYNYFSYRIDGQSNPQRDVYLNAWREENPSNTCPRITSHDKNLNGRLSDLRVEDGSYLRMKLIQLGYTLPEQFSQRLRIQSCRIWIGGVDLLTFTKYSGNDPEVSLYDPIISGIDKGLAYPKNRKITMGIHVEF